MVQKVQIMILQSGAYHGPYIQEYRTVYSTNPLNVWTMVCFTAPFLFFTFCTSLHLYYSLEKFIVCGFLLESVVAATMYVWIR